MKEKKCIKISLLAIILIIFIITIVITGVIIYNVKNDKNTEIKKQDNQQENILNEKNSEIEVHNNQILENAISDESNNNNHVSENMILNESTNNANLEEFQIVGKYYNENGEGDEPYYTFAENNKVTYGSLWTCSGSYSINNDIIKINFTSAVDPDVNKVNLKAYNVDEFVELKIITNNKIKDYSNGNIYLK